MQNQAFQLIIHIALNAVLCKGKIDGNIKSLIKCCKEKEIRISTVIQN